MIAQALRSSFIPCTQSLHQSANTPSVSLCHPFCLLMSPLPAPEMILFLSFFFLIFILNCFLNISTTLQLYRNLPFLEGIVLPAVLPNFGSFIFYFILQLHTTESRGKLLYSFLHVWSSSVF